MPYFKNHNILFIHIPKNAGMFIEKALGIPQEIVSYDQPTTKNNVKAVFKRKLVQLFQEIRSPKKKREIEKKYLHGTFSGRYIFQHASLEEVLSFRMLPSDSLENAKILAVHRHPISRTISIYKYWGFDKSIGFEEFCKTYVLNPSIALENFGLLMHLKPQVNYIKNTFEYSKNIHWLSLENLTDDLKNFASQNEVQLDLKAISNTVNRSSTKKIEISETAEQIIRSVYKEDFQMFGYK